jgi:predicted RNA-binding protein (virulence factor B family)
MRAAKVAMLCRLRLRSAIRHNSNYAFRLHAESQRNIQPHHRQWHSLHSQGDHDALLSYDGKQVQVTGTMKATKKTSSKPATFRVTEVKELADTKVFRRCDR